MTIATRISYFRDDHNRTVRVAVHSRGGIGLHVLINRGRGKVWVPYEPISSPLRGSDIEDTFHLSDLRAQNVSCPSYERT
jgi:hypothetical protein